MHMYSILLWTDLPARWTLRSQQSTSTNSHAATGIQEWAVVIYGYTKLPKKVSTMSAEVWEPLWKLTLVKTDWTWNMMYQDLHDTAKKDYQEGCMYGILWCIYILTLKDWCIRCQPWTQTIAGNRWHDFWAWWYCALLQQYKMRGPKSSKQARKILPLLLCWNVWVITDHKPIVTIISKSVATFSQWLQGIMIHIHQYRVCIIYTFDPDLYIVDHLSCNNHTENRDQEIICMNINMYTISTLVSIPVCTSIEDIQTATKEDPDLKKLKMAKI